LIQCISITSEKRCSMTCLSLLKIGINSWSLTSLKTSMILLLTFRKARSPWLARICLARVDKDPDTRGIDVAQFGQVEGQGNRMPPLIRLLIKQGELLGDLHDESSREQNLIDVIVVGVVAVVCRGVDHLDLVLHEKVLLMRVGLINIVTNKPESCQRNSPTYGQSSGERTWDKPLGWTDGAT
jgi:hypothetical protein